MTEESLAKVIPNKGTCVLTYCNINFRGDPINLQAKLASAALNIPTFILASTNTPSFDSSDPVSGTRRIQPIPGIKDSNTTS